MVAKATTKSGEFFCFHCGKQAQRQDADCKGCGSIFDKTTEAFRCPRCSNLLPIGAAACPACGLGFKVRTIAGASKLTDDDKFLMNLIDWSKQDEAPPPKPMMTRTVKPGAAPLPPPPPPPAITRKVYPETAKAPTAAVQTKAPQPPSRETPKEQPLPKRPPIKEPDAREALPPAKIGPPVNDLPSRLDRAEANLQQAASRNVSILDAIDKQKEMSASGVGDDTQNLYGALREANSEMSRIGSEIQELREIATKEETIKPPVAPAPAAPDESARGLSNQALKKLLEEREKEVHELREREEELARKEEHLNRKIRAYAVKKKELEALERQAEQGHKDETMMGREIGTAIDENDFPASLDVDDKQEWIKQQSKIKMGLIEIRNQMGSKKDSINYYPMQISDDMMEKLEVLEEKLADMTKERDDLSARLKKVDDSMGDIVALLKVLDQLLGKLLPETIDEFSKSKDFKLYEKVLDDLNI